MKHRTPKRFLQAHRLITGRDKLRRESHGKAEYKHLAELRSIYKDRNIVGLGISEKITNKKRAGELTLCFYVRQKKAKNRLGSHKMIPPVVSVGGGKPIFTDVYQIGRLKAQSNAQDDPIQSGFSAGNDKTSNAGTVGAIVVSGGTRYILSNAHVLAPQGHGTPGAINATYPAPRDSSQGIRRVGVLRHIVNLKSSDNSADAALAEISSGFNIDTSIFGATPPYTVGLAQEGMAVIGSGRTTPTIRGVVKDPHFAGPVSYPPPLGSLGFVDQILCIGASDGGDSGSLISAKDTGQILGLLFAGSGGEFVVTPIKSARDALQVDFQFIDPCK
jgi:hypothetical protein